MTHGTRLGHFEIVEQIGGGGMGIVYKAWDPRLKRHVALKFLPPEWSRDPAFMQRFQREAETASALEHDNICTIHEISQTEDGQLFLVMPAYDGESLDRRIAGGRLPVAEAIDIAVQTAEGLAKAHEAGVVHRDIKPANLFLTEDGSVKILDFGIAR